MTLVRLGLLFFVFVIACIFPQKVHAITIEVLNVPELTKEFQGYLDKATTTPITNDGYFETYEYEGWELIVDGTGTLVQPDFDIENIHLPLEKKENVYCPVKDGAYVLENNVLTLYRYGKKVSVHKLAGKRISGKVKKLLKYNEYWVVLGSNKNVYSIDDSYRVYQLTDSKDIQNVYFADILDIPDIQLVMVDEHGNLFYTTEIFVGGNEWLPVPEDKVTE